MVYRSYTTARPPVLGDNPRALASELSPIQTDIPWLNYFTTLISVDLAQYEIFHVEVCSFWQEWYESLIFISERSGNSDVLYYILDLADFTSIREFAKQVLKKETRLDILINNAGTLSLDYCYIFHLFDFSKKKKIKINNAGDCYGYVNIFLAPLYRIREEVGMGGDGFCSP